MADLGPSIVTVVGTLGGGVLGVVGTFLISRSSNKPAMTLQRYRRSSIDPPLTRELA